MKDTRTFIEETERELARTDEVLGELARALDDFSDCGAAPTPELLEGLERLCDERAPTGPAVALPVYAVPI